MEKINGTVTNLSSLFVKLDEFKGKFLGHMYTNVMENEVEYQDEIKDVLKHFRNPALASPYEQR